MNILDLIILIPIGWGMYKGFSKGVVHELAQVAALVLGVLAGLYLSDWIGSGIASLLNTDEQQTQLIAFLIAFLGTLALVFLVSSRVENAVKSVHLGLINRLLGGVFASIKFILIISIIINFINSADPHGLFLKQETRNGSLLYGPTGRIAPAVLPKVMSIMPEETSDITKDAAKKTRAD